MELLAEHEVVLVRSRTGKIWHRDALIERAHPNRLPSCHHGRRIRESASAPRTTRGTLLEVIGEGIPRCPEYDCGLEEQPRGLTAHLAEITRAADALDRALTDSDVVSALVAAQRLGRRATASTHVHYDGEVRVRSWAQRLLEQRQGSVDELVETSKRRFLVAAAAVPAAAEVLATRHGPERWLAGHAVKAFVRAFGGLRPLPEVRDALRAAADEVATAMEAPEGAVEHEEVLDRLLDDLVAAAERIGATAGAPTFAVAGRAARGDLAESAAAADYWLEMARLYFPFVEDHQTLVVLVPDLVADRVADLHLSRIGSQFEPRPEHFPVAGSCEPERFPAVAEVFAGLWDYFGHRAYTSVRDAWAAAEATCR